MNSVIAAVSTASAANDRRIAVDFDTGRDSSFSTSSAQGSLPEAIEAALKAVLEVDPANAQARHNMEVLYRNTGRWVEGVIDTPGGPPA